MIVDLDGQHLDAQQARVSPFDGAYLYGDGLFDTLRSYRGHLYRLEDHLARLRREAELLQLPLDTGLEGWKERLRALLEANDLMDDDARLRIQISRGGDAETHPYLADPEGLEPVVFVVARPVDPALERQQREGVRVMSLQNSFARGNFPLIKSLNYLPSVMALRFANSSGFAEALLLNRQQKVLEGASSNVFVVQGGRLRTPSTRLGLLPGITRDVVLELAGELGIAAEEVGFELRDLLIADEVFLTGSVKEVVPVIGVDRSVIGPGEPGPVTRRIQQAYRDDVERRRP